jgi:hypothetical protein
VDAGTGPNLSDQQIFASDSLTQATLTSVYYQFMLDKGTIFNGGVSWLAGLSADELVTLRTSSDRDFYYNDISPYNVIIEDTLWTRSYKYIYICNKLVEGLSGPNSITKEVKDRIMGEAKFLRAFCYYFLSGLFGDVPLVLETLYTKSAYIPRTPVSKIYQHMVTDLQDAEPLLDNSRTNAFAGKLACQALLARIYLHLGDWQNAEKYSSAVIQSGLVQLENNLDNVFVRTSKEIIFQLEPFNYPHNALEADLFLPAALDEAPRYFLSDNLVASFQPGDQRKERWMKTFTANGTAYNVPLKYKVRSATTASNEYNVVLRLAEQYLIRAEARVRSSNVGGAVDDLNVIRSRAGLNPLSATLSPDACLQAIEKERRWELFTEWGHRWFDLKRTGRINEVMKGSKMGYWDSTDVVYPIPSFELAKNPNLIQNAGY